LTVAEVLVRLDDILEEDMGLLILAAEGILILLSNSAYISANAESISVEFNLLKDITEQIYYNYILAKDLQFSVPN
jgi:hypothetical protein